MPTTTYEKDKCHVLMALRDMLDLKVPKKPGVYTLVIELASATIINVGGLGVHSFPAGFYAYTGSAHGKGAMNLRRRIQHHLTRGKRKHWHIDYLLDSDASKVKTAIFAETLDNVECAISKESARLEGAEIPVKGFGSSDCRSGCKAHLCFYHGISYSELVEHLSSIYQRIGSPKKVGE